MPPIDQPDDEDEVSGLEDPSDAALRALLEKKLTEGASEETEEADGLLAPPDEPSKVSSVVSADEGFEMAENARRNPKPAASDDPEPGEDIDSKIAAKPEDAPSTPAADEPVTSTQSIDELLEGLDDTRRAKIQERLTAGDAVLSKFAGREEELKLHGNPTPAEAVERLLYLNSFAQKKPDEYLAWAATQFNPEKPNELLEAAAKHLGYKLVPDDDGEDEFEDEEKKRLRLENKRLTAAQGPGFGPDVPQNQAAAEAERRIRSYMGANNADGTPRHPFAEKFKDEVAAKVAAFVKDNNGQMPTTEDLSRFYFEVVPPALAPAAPAREPGKTVPDGQDKPQMQTSAAQPAPAVPEQAKKAANPARAAASKMLDGSGQGAGHRPALTGDALLRSQIAAAISKASGG